jgi:hypothetical protein
MTDLPQRMVEAAAIARAKEDGKPDWNALMDHEQARYRAEAGTSLRAALALAEEDGVLLVRVPKQVFSMSIHGDGRNAAIREMLAGRVEV